PAGRPPRRRAADLRAGPPDPPGTPSSPLRAPGQRPAADGRLPSMADQERQDPDNPDTTDVSLELPRLRSAFRRDREPAESAQTDTQITPSRHVTTRRREPEPDPAPAASRKWAWPRPHLPGWLAAVVVGAVVGLALVGLTVAGLHACTAMRGTPS